MKHACGLGVLVMVALVVAAAGAFGDDWTQFQGPERNGISNETGLLKQWPDGGPKLLWTATGCGTGFSSAAIAAGTVYVAGDVGENCQVMALDLTGKVKWTKVIGKSGQGGGHPGARSTPTVDGDSVYCLGPVGDLACLDAKTGNVKWSGNIINTFKGRIPQWQLAESVLIDGNNLICTPGGQDTTLVALNKKTGAPVWTSKGLSDPAAYASPILFTVGKLRMISTLTARGVVAVDASNGKFLWRYDRPSNTTANIPSPAFYKDCVFCATGYKKGGGLVQVTVNGTEALAKELWQTSDFVNHHGGYVIIDDHIYGYGDGGGWTCLDFKTGQVAWQVQGVSKGSVIAADGMLYCLGERRVMGLMKVDPAAGELVSHFRLPTKGPEPSWAHPAIANGRLYIRDFDSLLCYDIKGK